MSATDLHSQLLDRYQQLLHERLVSRRASEDYLYWVRRFLSEIDTMDELPSEGDVRAFLRTLKTENLSSSAERRAEVALDLMVSELLDQNVAA